MSSLRLGLALTALAGVIGGPAHAFTWGRVGTPISYIDWTIKPKSGAPKTRVSQFYFPFVVTAGLTRNADLVISTSLAGSGVEGGGQPTNSLGGAAPFTAQLFARFADDRLLLQGGVTAPSGQWALDPEEMSVAHALGFPVLGFGLKEYGSGLNLGGAATIAFPMSPSANLSIGVGGIHRGEFTLQAGGGSYRPALERALTAGLDLGTLRTDGSGQPLHLDATYRSFGDDEIDGVKVFAEGDQLELQAEGRSASVNMRSYALARAVLKSENTIFTTTGSAVASFKASSGDGYFVRAGLDRPMRGSLRAGGEFEWNHVVGSDTFGRNGTAYGAGPSLISPLGTGGIILELRGLILWGNIEGTNGGSDSDLRGFSISANFQWRPPS